MFYLPAACHILLQTPTYYFHYGMKEINFILNTVKQYLTKAPSREDVLSVFAGLRPLAAPVKNTNSTKDYEEKVREKIAPFRDVPILFVSVLEKQRLMKVVETAMMVYANRTRHISTSKLNDFFLPFSWLF